MARRRTKVKRRRVQSAAQGRAYHEETRSWRSLADQLYTVDPVLISNPKPRKTK